MVYGIYNYTVYVSFIYNRHTTQKTIFNSKKRKKRDVDDETAKIY